MILLDAYPLIAHLRGEPAASQAQAVMRRRDVAITAVNLCEVADVLCRSGPASLAQVRETVGQLVGELIHVLPVDERIAWRAADLRATHYERRDAPLSLADCTLLAAAGPDDTIVTADPVVLRVAGSEGIDVIALPDSDGRMTR